MTFGICLFIVLMQFLWKYIQDMVGKGLELSVFAELFFYAALNLVSLALPLAILLASLMTFGNLGENLELLATKAAGVPLLKTMRPLIIFICMVSIGAFFFQNNAIPVINVKFSTLLRSVKNKSPELIIPEGAFYNGIDNFNIYVKSKDKETGTLFDVMIYDTSQGFNNMRVIVCDSAKVKDSKNKDILLFNLYSGQQFANATQDMKVSGQSSYIPYTRENFREKKIVIPFDANFNRIDESFMEGSQVTKGISELAHSIDSISVVVDSMNMLDREITRSIFLSDFNTDTSPNSNNKATEQQKEQANIQAVNFDSLLSTFDHNKRMQVYNEAAAQAQIRRDDLMYRAMPKDISKKSLRQHYTEFHRKFTLSFACLVFFFIGAPLGAIIRKGGLGMPVVISVVLFIVYYIIDNVGYKMARDGVWVAWAGVWLSSFVLFPLGVFLTYKANNDSALFNPDAYRKFAIKVLGHKKADKILHFGNKITTTFVKVFKRKRKKAGN
ncbi:lipopolysaccharide export system permease protein [Dysgonomonas sp. PH5-45]|nr:lipopolysaccharide export system permease protein [Dysgonomonas sp. PH5-45]MDH6387648.1 lipopolysaccharide export system permease protein [Dysgonomonas sp. PH5-37]